MENQRLGSDRRVGTLGPTGQTSNQGVKSEMGGGGAPKGTGEICFARSAEGIRKVPWHQET